MVSHSKNVKKDSPAEFSQAHSLIEGIRLQRDILKKILLVPMASLAQACSEVQMRTADLEELLTQAIPNITSCIHLFVLDNQFIQVTDNITRDGNDPSHKGRDRSGQSYTVNIIGHTEFKLSEAYISRRKKRPSLTAMQTIKNKQGILLGFLGADFDMRELPHTEHCYLEPDNWHQLRGDPVIRRNLFYQQRVDSIMDDNIDDTLDTMRELIIDFGVFSGELYFSRSRAIVWHRDDPFTYHLLTANEMTTPNIFLAYPKLPYFERAQVPPSAIKPIFDMFKELRFADDNVYLRSGSLNIVNAMVGLNFSCDGSHYMRFDKFLDENIEFWFGAALQKSEANIE